MFWQKPFILLGLLAAVGSSAPSLSKRLDLESQDDEFVYFRADTRDPKEVKALGGFKSRGLSNGLKENFSLWNHCKEATKGFSNAGDDGFISVSADFSFCKSWVEDKLGAGTIYKIASDANLVDCQATLKHYNPIPEEVELAAISIIPWNQIMGWYDQYSFTNNEKIRDAVYTENPDFAASKYHEKADGGAQYQLAGFPKGHAAWMQKPWSEMTEASCSAESSKGGKKSGKKNGRRDVDDIEDIEDNEDMQLVARGRSRSSGSRSKPSRLSGARRPTTTKPKTTKPKTTKPKTTKPKTTKPKTTKPKATKPKTTKPKTTKPKTTKPKTTKKPSKKCTAAMKKAGKCDTKCTAAMKKAGKCGDMCTRQPIKTNKQFYQEYLKLLKAGKAPKSGQYRPIKAGKAGKKTGSI